MRRLLGIAMLSFLLVSNATYAGTRSATDAEIAQIADAIGHFMGEFSKPYTVGGRTSQPALFHSVISLGEPGPIASNLAKVRVLIDPELDTQGKFAGGWAERHWWSPNFMLASDYTLRSATPIGWADRVTTWHEYAHLVMHFKDKQPCGPDETYTELLESRVGWLQQVRVVFDTPYQHPADLTPNQHLVNLLDLKGKWNLIEAYWKAFGLAEDKYTWQDQASCKPNHQKYTIDRALIDRLDRELNVDVKIEKVRRVYPRLDEKIPSLPQDWCSKEQPRTLRLTSEDRRLKSGVAYKVPMLKLDSGGDLGTVTDADFENSSTIQVTSGNETIRGNIGSGGREIHWSNGKVWKVRETEKCTPAVYQLMRIELERTYPSTWVEGEFIGGKGKSVASAGARSFQLGWKGTFKSGMSEWNYKGVAIATGDVALTEVPTTLQGTTPMKFSATIKGYWDMQGYGVERDHTVTLSGAAGQAKWSTVGQPSRVVTGEVAATSASTSPTGDEKELTALINARINFGGDNWADLNIRLIYQPQYGDAPTPTPACDTGRC
jgi:hypothetical protein